MTTYALAYNNGNTGDIKLYQTIDEAVNAAEIMWYRLSRNDQRRYTYKAQGAYFVVCEMDEEEMAAVIKDYSMVDVCMDRREAMYAACNLYDGGWRAGDKKMLIAEYEISEEYADMICEALEEIEREDE